MHCQVMGLFWPLKCSENNNKIYYPSNFVSLKFLPRGEKYLNLIEGDKNYSENKVVLMDKYLMAVLALLCYGWWFKGGGGLYQWKNRAIRSHFWTFFGPTDLGILLHFFLAIVGMGAICRELMRFFLLLYDRFRIS